MVAARRARCQRSAHARVRRERVRGIQSPRELAHDDAASLARPRRLPPHAVEERRRPHDRDRREPAGRRPSMPSRGAPAIADDRARRPFSAFPGVDRTLVLLDGAGVRLVRRRRRRRCSPRLRALPFAGEQRSTARSSAGPARDFNLMVRRDARAARSSSCATSACRCPRRVASAVLCGEGACECLIAGHAPIGVHPAMRCWWTDETRRALHVNPRDGRRRRDRGGDRRRDGCGRR